MQRRQSSTFAWPALCAAALLALLFGGLSHLPPAKPVTIVEERLRCLHCGWIESKREIVPQLIDPHAMKVYEYTLRMADGSLSVFQETQPTSWRLGERVMLITPQLSTLAHRPAAAAADNGRKNFAK